MSGAGAASDGRAGSPAPAAVLGKDAVVYAVVFAALGLPWLLRLRDAVPADYAQDGWLIAWVLDWCWHALTSAPGTLFDPPVNYPAPAQLAGSEHFLSSQLVFGPLRWATGDSIVAANLTAFLSYPLAAIAMEALALKLGVARAAAFTVGLLYALGQPSPGRLHVLQMQYLYFPLAALVLRRLRERETWRSWMAASAVFVAGLFSSYHMAVYLTVAAALWGAGELLRKRSGRGRYGLAAATAWGVGAVFLLVVSAPYLARPEAAGDLELTASRWGTKHLETDTAGPAGVPAGALDVAAQTALCLILSGDRVLCLDARDVARVDPRKLWVLCLISPPYVFVVIPLVVLGVVTAIRGSPSARTVAVAALAIGGVGFLLAGPEYARVGGMAIPLPATWLQWTPARFIRERVRSLALTFFASTVLVAYGLDASRRRSRAWGRLATALVVATTILRVGPPPGDAGLRKDVERANDLVSRRSRFAPIAYQRAPTLDRDRETYRSIAAHVQRVAPGPLLEWPSAADQGSAVVGQMVHRQPSIDFYTGYVPAHLDLVEALVKQLPAPAALDDLVDATGLRWILVRPASEWPDRHDQALAELTRHPRVREVTRYGDFVLVQLDPTSHHPDWFAHLAATPQRNLTPLGTPLRALPRVPATIGVSATLVPSAEAERLVPVTLRAMNLGAAGLPAALPGHPGRPFSVRFELAWRRVGDDGDVEASHPIELRRDVPAGEWLAQTARLVTPKRPGAYVLEVALRQVDGTDLSGPDNPVRVPVTITPRSEPAPAPGTAPPPR